MIKGTILLTLIKWNLPVDYLDSSVIMKRRRTGGPVRQIYLRSDKNCLVTGPTVRREI